MRAADWLDDPAEMPFLQASVASADYDSAGKTVETRTSQNLGYFLLDRRFPVMGSGISTDTEVDDEPARTNSPRTIVDVFEGRTNLLGFVVVAPARPSRFRLWSP